MIKVLSLFPSYCNNMAISQVFYQVCSSWEGSDLSAHMIVASCEENLRRPNLTEAIPPLWHWYYYKFRDYQRKAETLFLKKFKDFDAAYLWPGVSIETLALAKASGKPIFVEQVNCFTGYAKSILDQAYLELGLEPAHNISQDLVQCELVVNQLADFLICPSQQVSQSFLAAGVPAHKIITTSEGWCPERFPYLLSHQSMPQLPTQEQELTVVFIGNDSIRKGLHHLLEIWQKANIKGKLIIVGQLDPIVAQRYGEVLSRSDVQHMEANPNYAEVYRQADLFVLPSLEEGSPLVTYEAMAHGLPVLASPMGAGGIVRDGIDGFVIPLAEEERWVDALVELATDRDLRWQMGAAARQQAEYFTWDKVALRRADLMLQALSHRRPQHPSQQLAIAS